MSDAEFDEVLAGVKVAAAEPSSATESAAPEPETPPEESAEQSQPTPAETTAAVETPAEPATPAATSQPAQPAQPAPIDWNSPDNPYRQDAEVARQMRMQAEQIQRIQAQQQLQQTIAAISEGDADRQQQLLGLLANVTTPLQQTIAAQDQRATAGEKTATALWIAMQASMDEGTREQVKTLANQLMTVEGPDQMERIAFTRRDAAKQYGEQLALKDQEIAELKRQINARVELADRQGRGADAVDAGRGTGGGGSPAPAQTNDFDGWFDSLWQERRTA